MWVWQYYAEYSSHIHESLELDIIIQVHNNVLWDWHLCALCKLRGKWLRPRYGCANHLVLIVTSFISQEKRVGWIMWQFKSHLPLLIVKLDLGRFFLLFNKIFVNMLGNSNTVVLINDQTMLWQWWMYRIKVCGCHLDPLLNWTLRFGWYVVLWGWKSKHYEDTCSVEVELHLWVSLTTIHSIRNTIGRTSVFV